MRLKAGVRPHGLAPEIMLGISICHQIFLARGLELVITSLVDGKHSVGSLHYVGHAADFRTRNIEPEDVQTIAQECRDNLGDDYDFVVEKNHYHMEFQPKKEY